MPASSDPRPIGSDPAWPSLIARSVAAVRGGAAPLPGASIALLELLGVAVDAAPEERPIADDQTNSSVVVGERYIVKWLRVPDPVDRGSLLSAQLLEGGFSDFPALVARLREPTGTCAVVHEYLPGAVDGWTWCVDEALTELDGGPATDWAAEVGDLVGRLAVAFASPSALVADPLQTRVGIGELVSSCAIEVGAATRFAAGPDLAALWAATKTPDQPTAVTSTPTHGDLHVGQVLRWAGGYAVVDFDGDPQRDESEIEPPDVDLAHLLVSVELVGSVAARRRDNDSGIAEWVERHRRELLAAYRERLASAGLASLHVAALLAVLELRQLARELEYAAAYLPRFEYASAAAIARRVALVGEDTA